MKMFFIKRKLVVIPTDPGLVPGDEGSYQVMSIPA
jgi:hypothetical protein